MERHAPRIVIDDSRGINYDVELSITVVIMFIEQATNCGVTYQHHLRSFMIIKMFIVQAKA